MKKLIIPKGYFKDLKFKIKIKPGKLIPICHCGCCGVVNCEDEECKR